MPISEWKALFLLGIGTLAVSYFSVKAAMAILATLAIIAGTTHAKTLANYIGTFQ